MAEREARERGGSRYQVRTGSIRASCEAKLFDAVGEDIKSD